MTETNSISKKQKGVLLSLLEIDTGGFQAILVKIDDHPRNEANDLLGRLTEAEADVAFAAAAGLSNREIAEQRGSSARTVAVQLRSVYVKMGISSRVKLAVLINKSTHK